MYESFYGLSGKPFNLTPDPRFLYLSDKHREAFAHLLYGIQNRSGFIMVAGEIGTGKTTLCRSLLNQLDTETEVAFVFNPFLSSEELLRKINEEFGIPTRAITVKGLIDELNGYLLERAAQNKNCVLVIDEAQNLDVPVLELIRLLSNLETETQKLLQIVLIGQPELSEKLDLPELRQLNQRITARYHLKPLSFQETLQYIAFRLSVAGGRRKVRFTRGAIKQVYKQSKGTPRVINALCDRALLIGYTRETFTITSGIVKQAAREIRGEKLRAKRAPRNWNTFARRAVLTTGALAAAAVAVVASAPDFPVAFRENARELWREYADPDAVVTRTAATPAAEAVPVSLPAPAPPPVRRVIEKREAEQVAPVASEAVAAEPEQATVSLASLLEGAASAEAQAGMLNAIMSAWHRPVLTVYPSDDTASAIRGFATANGLAVEELPLTPDQIRTINLPLLARVSADGDERWVALLGVDEAGYLVQTNDVERLVSAAEFELAYTGETLLLWVDFAAKWPPLYPGDRGAEVKALQELMQVLGLMEGGASGVYDAATADAVRAVQRASGLKVDGIAGEQTRMVLMAWLTSSPTPSLAEESFPETVRARVLAARSGTPPPLPAVAQAAGAPDPLPMLDLDVASEAGVVVPATPEVSMSNLDAALTPASGTDD